MDVFEKKIQTFGNLAVFVGTNHTLMFTRFAEY